MSLWIRDPELYEAGKVNPNYLIKGQRGLDCCMARGDVRKRTHYLLASEVYIA